MHYMHGTIGFFVFFSLHFGVVHISFFICKLSANKSSRNAIFFTALFGREAEMESKRDGKSLCLPLFSGVNSYCYFSVDRL